MQLERLTYNKIKIILSFEDLSHLGLTKEDIWKDSLKWHQIFFGMLHEAGEKYGVEIHESVTVEIFSGHTKGLIMIITVDDQEDFNNDEFTEMNEPFRETEEMLFEFTDIEEIINLSKRLKSISYLGGSLYKFGDRYFLAIDDFKPDLFEQIYAIVSEYGYPSNESIYQLKEYGIVILEEQSIETLTHFFK